MRGPLDWQRLVLKMGELFSLSDGEARILSVLAAHVDRGGLVGVVLTEAEIAKRVQRSPRTVRRLLSQLRRRRIVSTTYVSGRARHQLHDVLPVEQPSLFEARPDGSSPVSPPVIAVSPPDMSPPVTAVTYPPGHSCVPQERDEEVVVVAARETEDLSSPALASSLGSVLDILRSLPDPYRHVEVSAIDSALRAYPDRDHVSAAHIVASKVNGGQAQTYHVNSLLMGVLSRMPAADATTPAAADGAKPTGKWWDGALKGAMGGATA